MDYGLSYREKHNLSESDLTDAQRALNFIAENMKMQKSISEEGYKYFQQAIEALGRSGRLNDTLNEIKAEIEGKIVKRPWLDFEDRERDRNDAFLEVLDIIDKYNTKYKDIEAQKKDGEWVNFAEDLIPIIKDDDLER